VIQQEQNIKNLKKTQRFKLDEYDRKIQELAEKIDIQQTKIDITDESYQSAII
jgi:hypothetical protein